jgi:serine/threonine protein phosphatase 1
MYDLEGELMMSMADDELIAKAPASWYRYCGADAVFAIGDVHGMADQLEILLQRYESRRAVFNAQGVSTEVVMLGDYVDRGPDSARVVETAKQFSLSLCGNHEDMMAFTMENGGIEADVSDHWIANGGGATIDSYRKEYGSSYIAHLYSDAEWIRTMPHAVYTDRYLFVHAGIDPRSRWTDQSRDALMWVRNVFLDSTEDHGKVVVHGHSPRSESPEILPNRINLDTGAVFGGALTGAWFFKDREPEFESIKTDRPARYME